MKEVLKYPLTLTAIVLAALLDACPADAQDLHLEPWVLAIGTEAPPGTLLGDEEPMELSKGDKAPYDGVLMTRDMAARWTVRLDWYRSQLKEDTTVLRAIMVKEVSFRDAVRKVELDSKDRELNGCRSDLREQASKFAKASVVPFYKRPGFGYGVGITLGAVLGIVTVVLAR